MLPNESSSNASTVTAHWYSCSLIHFCIFSMAMSCFLYASWQQTKKTVGFSCFGPGPPTMNSHEIVD